MGENTGLNGIIDKIIDLLGLDVVGAQLRAKSESIKQLSDAKTKNEIEIKNAILNNSTLTLDQKLQLNSMLGTNYKKFKRQMDVLGIAIDNMEQDCSKNNIEEDWVLDFFEKVSNISNEDIQKLWGKLLSSAASDKNICSKTLLNSMFLMSCQELQDFINLSRFCFSSVGNGGDTYRINTYPIVYFAKNVKSYQQFGITRLRLNKLAQLGLIDVNYEKEFIFSTNKERLIYKNRIIELNSRDKLYIGNVIFTYDGFLLYQMTEKIFDSLALDLNTDIWKNRGYEVSIKRYNQ